MSEVHTSAVLRPTVNIVIEADHLLLAEDVWPDGDAPENRLVER
jgi:hypothetical protein